METASAIETLTTNSIKHVVNKQHQIHSNFGVFIELISSSYFNSDHHRITSAYFNYSKLIQGN